MGRGSEEFPNSRFMDVGALAYYLKACPWVIEGFEIGKDRLWLQRIHERILCDGSLLVPGHLYWFEAYKPEPPESKAAAGDNSHGTDRDQS